MTLYRSSTNPNLPLKQRHQVLVKVEILLANHNMKKQIHLILRKLLKMTALVLFIKVINQTGRTIFFVGPSLQKRLKIVVLGRLRPRPFRGL